MLIRILLGLFVPGATIGFAQTKSDTLQVLRKAQVLFASGQWAIRPQDTAVLQEIVQQWRQAGSGAFICIQAHTDAVGTSRSNLLLSQRRAHSVAALLQAMGVSQNTIEAAYWGEESPIADNDSEESRQRNRRAEIAVLAPIPIAPTPPPTPKVTLSGRVTDKKTGEPIQATVFIITTAQRDSLQTDENGNFSIQLPENTTATLEAFALGYFFYTKTIRVRADRPTVNLSLVPAVSGEKIALRNLLFYGNQAVLLPDSESELPKVLRFMQLNPSVRIEIAGHINNPYKRPDQLDAWEWNLSVNRAKVVYEYLLKNGISPERMRYKGYGNTEMLYPSPDATEEEQAQNRRVEIRIQ
ncbi:MAG: OmpA family protein [Saprospiraceae bacterium]|nr:OmpA family protein [Saprospiraceae bacterium]MDW8485054.1 OmpA family protein [Saprospiraceae bacterium]